MYGISKFRIASKFHTKQRYLNLTVKTDPPLTKTLHKVLKLTEYFHPIENPRLKIASAFILVFEKISLRIKMDKLKNEPWSVIGGRL